MESNNQTVADDLGSCYVAKAGNQRIIVEEGTGRNVAVVYDAKDADILAAAPDLLSALGALGAANPKKFTAPTNWDAVNSAWEMREAAITKAKGGA